MGKFKSLMKQNLAIRGFSERTVYEIHIHYTNTLQKINSFHVFSLKPFQQPFVLEVRDH